MQQSSDNPRQQTDIKTTRCTGSTMWSGNEQPKHVLWKNKREIQVCQKQPLVEVVCGPFKE